MNTIKHFLLLLAFVSLAGCSKEKKDSDNNNPAKYDKSNLGSYSGVLVGSSGTIHIELKTTGATATIVFDGVTYQLSATTAIPAGAKITGYTLQRDNIKVVIDVNADGSVPQVAVTIPGHDITSVVYKVTSTGLVENYTGTFAVTDAQFPQYNNSGVFNFTIKGDVVQVVSKCKSGDCGDTDTFTGKIARSGNDFTIQFDNCNPVENICTLPFIKNSTGYKAILVEDGSQLVVEVKKVQ